MKPTQRTLSTVAGATVVLMALMAAHTPTAEAAGPPIRFGLDLNSIDAQTNAGIKPDYATIWAGAWLLPSGFAGFDAGLQSAKTKGVMPLIHFYYWGNDLNSACFTRGCQSTVHGVWKDQAGWTSLATQLDQHLNSQMGGRPVLIVMETEFNKGDMASSEALDAALAAKATYLRNNYPAAQIVLGFGNWGRATWSTFDRAAAASQFMGVQSMRASTRDSLATYQGAVADVLAGARDLQRLFHKPVIVHDLAFASYTEPGWLKHQSDLVASLFRSVPDLKAAGVQGINYRGYEDSPTATTVEFYGEAERHFGLRWSANHTAKPAFTAWRDGVLKERGAPVPAGAAPQPAALVVPASGSAYSEIERFQIHTTGASIANGAASGQAAWNLWSNGYAQQGLRVDQPGTYEFRVRALGKTMGGVAPHMELRLDDRTFGTANPGPNAFQDYVGRVTVGAGAHALKIVYTNDASSATEDRNLWLDRLEVKRVA
jgi:hypothetical protein